MEFLLGSDEIKLFNFYEFITSERYFSSQIDGKENLIIYFCYILNQLGFETGRYKFTFEESCGVYSYDLICKIKLFNGWSRVSLANLIKEEYSKMDTLKNLSKILKENTESSYCYKDFVGCIAALLYIKNNMSLEELETLDYLENNSPFIDKTSNIRALNVLSELKK